MSDKFKGSSPLAALVDSMPIRSRVGVALLAADIGLDKLKSSRGFPVARKAFELGRAWYDGERFDLKRLDRFDDELNDVSLASIKVASENEKSAWSALANAVAYTGLHAYRLAGEIPAPTISQIEDAIIDAVEQHVRAILPPF